MTNLDQRICVLTGASSGIGFETARGLAESGARVALLCRARESGEAARQKLIEQTGRESFDLFVADLASQKQIRRVADEIRIRFGRVDVLINNAAVLYSQRTLSEDGIEMQFAVNHLAPYLLTRLLLNHLKCASHGRIVTLSSRVHFRAGIDFDDLNATNGYFALKAYGQSKLANVLFTYELARRLTGSRVTANCLHPGLVRTHIGHKHASPLHSALHSLTCLFAASPRTAARAVIHLAAAPELSGVSGAYFAKTRQARSAAVAYDEKLAARLWEVSAKLTGLPVD